MSKPRPKTVTPPRLAPAATARDAEDPAAPGQAAGGASEEDVRVRAYHLWEAAGRPPGDGVDFWLDAERELARGGELRLVG